MVWDMETINLNLTPFHAALVETALKDFAEKLKRKPIFNATELALVGTDLAHVMEVLGSLEMLLSAEVPS